MEDVIRVRAGQALRVTLLAVMVTALVSPGAGWPAGLVNIFLPALDVYFPHIVPSMTLAYLLILVSGVLFWASGGFGSEAFATWTYTKIAIFAMFAALIVVTALSQAPSRSMWGTYERMGGLLGLAHWYWYIVMLGIAFRGCYFDWVMNTFIGVAFIVGVMAWGESIGSGTHPLGLFGNQSFTGAFLAVAGIASVGMAVRIDRRHYDNAAARVIAYGASGLALGIMVFITGSRAGVLAYVVALAVMLAMVVFMRWGRLLARNWFWVEVVGGVAIVLLGFPIAALFAQNEIVDHSVRDRVVVAMTAIEGVRDRPWVGTGLGNFEVAYHENIRPELLSDGGRRAFDNAHNEPLNVLVTQGVVGLAAHLALWAVLAVGVVSGARSGDEDRRTRAIIAGGVLAAHLIVMQFLFFTLATYLTLALAVFAAMSVERQGGIGTAKIGAFSGARTGAVVILFVIALGFQHVSTYRAARLTGQAIRAQGAGSWTESLATLDVAARLAPGKSGEVARVTASVPLAAIRAKVPGSDVARLVKLGIESEAVAAGLRHAPMDWKLRMRLSTLYALAAPLSTDPEALKAESIKQREVAWGLAPAEMARVMGNSVQ